MIVNHIEDDDLERLVQLKRWLYSDQPLSGDQRRDLANAMDALLAKIVRIDLGEVVENPVTRGVTGA